MNRTPRMRTLTRHFTNQDTFNGVWIRKEFFIRVLRTANGRGEHKYTFFKFKGCPNLHTLE